MDKRMDGGEQETVAMLISCMADCSDSSRLMTHRVVQPWEYTGTDYISSIMQTVSEQRNLWEFGISDTDRMSFFSIVSFLYRYYIITVICISIKWTFFTFNTLAARIYKLVTLFNTMFIVHAVLVLIKKIKRKYYFSKRSHIYIYCCFSYIKIVIGLLKKRHANIL